MKMKLSIDIGSKNLHIAEGRFHKGQIFVRHSQSFSLPAGCVEEEAVKDEQLLADVIVSAVRAGKYTAKEAVLTMNASNAIIREVDFPPAKPKELDSMIRNEMVQTFHILNSDIIQYKEIGRVATGEGDTLKRYRTAALNQDIVEAYYNVLERAKLKAAAMDLNINAIEKLFTWTDSLNERPKGDEAAMLLDFGHAFTTVYIFSKDQPMFYRHLSIGAGMMDSALLEQSNGQISEELQPYFYRLNDEIRKIVTFYHDRAHNSNIGCTYLAGQGSELPGLCEYWSEVFHLPVERLTSIGRVNHTIKIDPPHLNAVAALIRFDK